MHTKLTVEQKMHVLASAYSSKIAGQEWKPESGQYYTTIRPDLELYKIIGIINDKVITTYLDRECVPMEWDLKGFTTEGFGPHRIPVPDWIFTIKQTLNEYDTATKES